MEIGKDCEKRECRLAQERQERDALDLEIDQLRQQLVTEKEKISSLQEKSDAKEKELSSTQRQLVANEDQIGTLKN